VFERRGSRRRDQLRQCRCGRARLRHPLGGARACLARCWATCSAAMRRCVWAGLGAPCAWMWRWWRACRPAVYRRNRSAHAGLAHYSRQRLQVTADTCKLDFDRRPRATWCCCARTRRPTSSQPRPAAAEGTGRQVPRCSNPDRRASSPAERRRHPLAGAIHLPHDGVGNCRQFRAPAEGRGAAPGCDVPLRPRRVARRAGQTRPRVDRRRRPGADFDAVVVCAGVQANQALLRRSG
jgi:D-amino-acid dehydrogenase